MDLTAKLREAQEVLARDTYNREKPKRSELAWAKRSPKYLIGDRVLAYKDDEPGTILCADTRYPGHWFVLWDVPRTVGAGRRDFGSIAWDQLREEPKRPLERTPTMRTVKEIEADIKNTKGAYSAMANVSDAEPEGKGIFLDNCARRLERLEAELKEAKKPTAWDKLDDKKLR